MKLSTIFSTALLFVGSSLAETHYRAHCEAKAPEVINAVHKLCNLGGTAMVAPTQWSIDGQWSKDNGKASSKAHVSIDGDCDPKEWVPQGICYEQFWQMCAHGDEHGNHGKRFGTNLCQSWWISHN